MAFTRRWQDLTTEVSRLIKGIPISWPLYCDMVSSDMFTNYPWRDALQCIATGQIPLSDGVQDYSVPANIYRLTKASIARTDLSPALIRELNVQTDLDENPVKRSYMAIQDCSLQAGIGQLRLDAAIEVPSGAALELRGEYQINSPKVSSLSDWMWFQDHYSNVAFLGLLYWGYKLADDSRAGTAQVSSKGPITYTGTLGEYMAALQRMKESEEYGSTETYYPSESMGADRDWGQSLPYIFGR